MKAFSVAGFALGVCAFLSAQTLFASPEPEPTPYSYQLIPLPVYATEPNEGNTWGLMPVILTIKSANGRTESIYAPSLTWNSIIGTSATLRWFYYPTDTETLVFNASASSHVNGGVYVNWEDRPKGAGQWTDHAIFRLDRSIFYRFFGLGPETLSAAESSYTLARLILSYRRGLNLTPFLNVGLSVKARRDLVEPQAVPGYPSTDSAFPGAPGLGGSSVLSESLDLRLDSRRQGSFSMEGSSFEVSAGTEQGLSGSPGDVRFSAEARELLPELEWLQGGARFYAEWESASRLPFYDQPSLGGSFLLRGFIQDQFIDQGAWEAEIEQRIHLLTTHLFGVATDWRVDPFVAVGQVFSGKSDLFNDAKWTTGLGFRAFVKPNVLGRVDVATGGEGTEVYVELGYPY